MSNELSIKINGLDDKTSNEVIASLKEIIQSFYFLDLRRFSKILITSNFDRDVERLTIRKNKSLFKSSFKSNTNTYALVLNIPIDDDFEQILVLKSEFVANLTYDNRKQKYKDALHIVHHELAHIHDNNKKIDVFKDLIKTQSYRGLDSIIFPMAETSWSEYIANFISSQSAIDTKYPKLMAKTLIEKIEKTKTDVKIALEVYKINTKREELLKEVIFKIESLIKSASYLIGYLNGMKLTLAELDYKLEYRLEISYFKDIWETLKYELASIHQVYPDGFINLNIYRNLAFSIQAFFKSIGVVLDEDELKKVKIHIL